MDILRTTLPFVALLLIIGPLLGHYIHKVLDGQKHFMQPVLGRLEGWIYRGISVQPDQQMGWKHYCLALVLFNLFGFLLLFAMLMTQGWLPLNPGNAANMSWHTAFNTASSFMTNTNWQSYAGETGASYLSQMAGLAVQNFVSAATGIAVFAALVRGIMRRTTRNIGNFWADLTRSTLYILLPLSIIWSLLLVGQGVVQNFNTYTEATTLEGTAQVLPQGPAASQIAIKQLGTNGGGFFNANASHPFESPTPFANFLQVLGIFVIPVSLVFAYGRMVGSRRQGLAIFAAMSILFIAGLSLSYYSETHPAGVWDGVTCMEGKETRNGIAASILFSNVTTAASCGAVNCMHDSLTPLAGMVTTVNMMLGEVIFGGVGAGMYGILIFLIVTVFIAGLMVGRTPEFLGKKIEAFDIKMAMVAVLSPAFVILIFSALALAFPTPASSISAPGPHGLSQVLYAFSSAAGNNGSAFGGLNAATPFYNVMIGLGMLIGRFGIIVPVLAIAGNLAGKKITPASTGTLRTDNLLFVGLLISVILIVGGLTFFPALSLGPIAEHLLLQAGTLF